LEQVVALAQLVQLAALEFLCLLLEVALEQLEEAQGLRGELGVQAAALVQAIRLVHL